jgi:predicted nucleic acid-binding protein
LRWLLDVNALLALAYQGHAQHERVSRWYAAMVGAEDRLATSAITEIGFVRVSIQAGFEDNASEAVETLGGLKASSAVAFDFLTDGHGADRLPAYVKGAKQVTDGHLVALADDAAMQLATMDKGIPGAYIIPE